ncbi:MAG: hypothetical protein E7629_03315 [Ruminococcaceae bacterium]|nr:hypothetical protein [Oscillospiraceae bacterium]
MEVSLIIVELIFVLLGVFNIWRCARNGFIKCLFKFVRTILALTLAYFLVAPVAPIVAENFIEEPIYNYVHEEVSSLYESAGESLNVDDLIKDLPEVLQTEELKEKLNEVDASGDELIEEISKEISAPIVSIASSVIAFVALFIILFILLSIVMALLNALISKIKLFHLANTILGLVWGILIALILWTVISTLIRIFDFGIYEDTVVIKFFAEADLLEKLGILELGENLLTSIFN